MNIYLTIGHGDWLPVPYYRPTDGESHPYIDLRENPERIQDIPEAKDFPELQEFFKEVNGEGSFFRTLACITIPQEIPNPNFPYEMRSYVDVAFVPWEWGGDAVNDFKVFYNFTKSVHEIKKEHGDEVPENVNVYLNLKTSHNSDLNVPFWCMEWWIMAYGKTQDEAREAWRATLRLLQDFLLAISPHLEEEYAQAQKAS
jgi:hypothetical protein